MHLNLTPDKCVSVCISLRWCQGWTCSGLWDAAGVRAIAPAVCSWEASPPSSGWCSSWRSFLPPRVSRRPPRSACHHWVPPAHEIVPWSQTRTGLAPASPSVTRTESSCHCKQEKGRVMIMLKIACLQSNDNHKTTIRMIECCDWLPGHCNVVARDFVCC